MKSYVSQQETSPCRNQQKQTGLKLRKITVANDHYAEKQMVKTFLA
jgi:hypothetical protein